MRNYFVILVVCFAFSVAQASDLRVSSAEPLLVRAVAGWHSAKDSGMPGMPFETYRLSPPEGRNASVLISVLGKDDAEFSTPETLKNLVRLDSRPYVSSPDELAKIAPKGLKIAGGQGFYADFTDPDLVGKPVAIGNYKISTLVFLSLGTKYLIKCTVLSDAIDGPDYRDAIKILESIKIQN